MGFELLQYETLKQALPKVQSRTWGETTRVASLGYLESTLSWDQVRKIVDEDKLSSLRFNASFFRNNYGVGALPLECDGEVWTEAERQRYGIDKDVGSLREVESVFRRRMMGMDVLPFETFSLFSALNCYYQPFDVAPYFGVESIIDLNFPIDKNHHNLFDMVVEGGTIEHCIAPVEALSNVVRMLKKGGVALHFVPQTVGGHGYYNPDPILFYEFYKANGFTILDHYSYMCGQSTPCRIPYSPYHNETTPWPTQFCIMARKEKDVETIRRPTQGVYSVYTRFPHAFTYGPLLDKKASPSKGAVHPTGNPVYDAIMRHLAAICDEGRLSRIQADQSYVEDPYQLSAVLEACLRERADVYIKDSACRLAGKKVYFWIIDSEVHEAWKKEFSDVDVVGRVVFDHTIDGKGIVDRQSLPLISLHAAVGTRPPLPIVIFSDRKYITWACRMIAEQTPDIDLDIVTCWKYAETTAERA